MNPDSHKIGFLSCRLFLLSLLGSVSDSTVTGPMTDATTLVAFRAFLEIIHLLSERLLQLSHPCEVPRSLCRRNLSAPVLPGHSKNISHLFFFKRSCLSLANITFCQKCLYVIERLDSRLCGVRLLLVIDSVYVITSPSRLYTKENNFEVPDPRLLNDGNQPSVP